MRARETPLVAAALLGLLALWFWPLLRLKDSDPPTPRGVGGALTVRATR